MVIGRLSFAVDAEAYKLLSKDAVPRIGLVKIGKVCMRSKLLVMTRRLEGMAANS